MRASLLVAAAALALAGVALAQDRQEVIPARTVYWMDVRTGTGLAGMGGADAARLMLSGGAPSSATLDLVIGSQNGPRRGGVEATHTVPRAARIGPDLDLEPGERGQPGQTQNEYEQPRGRLYLFYGCGERAPRGQPIVIDFARVAQGETPPGLESRVAGARTPNSPAERGWPSVARGPHDRGAGLAARVMPAGASIVGDHLVRSSMAPDIRFALTAEHDIMAPVSFSTNEVLPSGAVNLVWNATPRATGFAVVAMGQGERQGDYVYWTSSAVQTWDADIFQFISPSEAQRLVNERVLLSPQTTTCIVPQEAARMMGAGSADQQRASTVLLTAFGPEANFVDPPRPSDPAIPWRQEWAVKVRLNSTTMEMLGVPMAAMLARAGVDMSGAAAVGRNPLAETAPPEGMSQEDWCRERAQAFRAQAENSPGANVGEAVGAATGIPGAGLLGRALGGRRRTPDDPYCPR
jgi:hypothetical protein